MGDKFDVEAALKEHPEHEIAKYLAEQHGIDRDAFLKDGHTDADFIKEFGSMPLPVKEEKTAATEEPAKSDVSNATNAIAGTAAVVYPKVASYGVHKVGDVLRKTLGLAENEKVAKPSGLMPPQNNFATPSQVEARTLKAGQPPRPEGPGDVINWALGKTPESGQYKRGYLGGTSQEHEAQLHRQADELERKNPGYKIKPGTANVLIPESEYKFIKDNELIAQKELEQKAKMNAAVRQQRLAQTQVEPTLGQRLGQGALNAGASSTGKQFMTGYNISDLLQAQNPFEAGVSAAGAAAPYGSQLLEKVLPRKYQGLAKIAGPVIGAAAPAVNYVERKLFPEKNVLEGHAAGGAIKGYAKGKAVLDVIEKMFEPVTKSGAQLAREASYTHNIKPTHTFSQVKPISIQDLQGGVLIPVPGDRSLAGHSLLSVNGVPLSKETKLYGGPRYGQEKADIGENAFWASQKGAASALQNKAIRAAELAKGNPVYGQYVAMDPFSSAYALHHTESLMNQLEALNPSKSNIKGFNEYIRAQHPDFLGITHPEVMDQFSKNPELRKYLADRLNKSSVVKQFGMPSGEATIHAITEPALRNVKTGTTGYSVGELSPSKSLLPEMQHPTYDTQIPGTFKGQMIAQLPWQHYFPEAAAKIAANPKQAPHAWGTFKMGDYNQPVTQELVDKIAPIEEMVLSAKKDFGHAEGGHIEGYAGGKSVSQIPKVAQALEQYLRGNISNADRLNVMNQHLPIRKWSELPPNYTDEQIRSALMANKQPKALADVPAGVQVGNRLDIPAYTQHGVYVDTVHDASGKPISYNRTGHLTDVNFSSKPNQAVRVGLGTKEQALTPMGAEIGSGKSPFAMMKGTNVGTHDDEVRRMMQEYLNDPNWTQIGMDPRRHSQFYDKSTGLPVWSAEQKLQSGPLVLVPKKGLETTHWEDPRLSLSDFEGKHYAGGGLAELAKKILPLAEREANKAKFLENTKVPNVMYHGTTKDFNQFMAPNERGVFLSPNPKFAESFASDAAGSRRGANIMPVHVNATNPFDLDNPKHRESLGNMMENLNFGNAHTGFINRAGHEGPNTWVYLEMPSVQKSIKDMGHDSYFVKEGGVKNLSIYDPRQIKSAIGNRGTFDPTSPDITKAEGGLMHLAGGGEAWQRSEGKNPEGGLNQKGRDSYNRAHGAHLKAPQPEGGSRKDSFCARMEGMKSKLTSSETAHDPDSRINKSLRKWKC
jgi:hypothetical protein